MPGSLLYETLCKYEFARGEYHAHPDDGLELIDCRITNAVRCVPPENKPTPGRNKDLPRFSDAYNRRDEKAARYRCSRPHRT
jgi:hypothetical protein